MNYFVCLKNVKKKFPITVDDDIDLLEQTLPLPGSNTIGFTFRAQNLMKLKNLTRIYFRKVPII